MDADRMLVMLLRRARSVTAPTTEAAPSADRPVADPIPWVAGLILVVVYALAAWAAHPDGYLSTDVGGKTAALAAMVERGDWSTDIGYWAAAFDPSGAAHPFANTWLAPNGWWVNTTSLPMVLAARPLWALGGSELILALPILAAVGTALAAGRLQVRLVGGSGLAATFLVGLGTPVAVYALEFWEHAPGLLLMVLGAIAAHDLAATDRPDAAVATVTRRLVLGFGAGLAFGVAGLMRQEALVYGFVAGLLVGVPALMAAVRRRHPASLAGPAAMAAAALAVTIGGVLVERAYYGGSLRATRSAASAGGAGSQALDRLWAAFATTFAPMNVLHPATVLMGAVLVLGLAWVVVAALAGRPVDRPVRILAVVAAAMLVRPLAFGPTFVPGMVAATPLALAGAVAGWQWEPARFLVRLAVLALPLVYLTQYAAGAVPQWGGRYLLLSGTLLAVVGVTRLAQVHRPLTNGLIAASVVVTGIGVWLVVDRSNAIDRDLDLLAEVADDDPVVWFDPHNAREGGPRLVGARWLSTDAGAAVDEVGEVLVAAEIDRFVYVDRPELTVPDIAGFEAVEQLDGDDLPSFLVERITVFRATGDD